MSFKCAIIAGLALTSFGSLSNTHFVANGDKYSQQTEPLIIKPSRCVVMNQGQKCHIDTDIRWQVSKQGHYCLLANETEIACWENSAHAQITQSFVTTSDIQVRLVKKNSRQVVAEKLLTVAWVFKKKHRQSKSWRRF